MRPPSAERVFDVGAVCFLNARPLISGLADDPRVRLALDVPAALGAGLDDGRLDAAMVPVIDLQRSRERWVVVPDAVIASDGETLTVRIFSRVPVNRIAELAVDADSHTSVALARLVLGHRFGLSPRIVPADMRAVLAGPAEAAPDAILLIGDKVVAAGPNDPASPWPTQLDLGAAWRAWTGLPFVFAVWAARADADLGDLPGRLSAARDRGLARLEQIARDEAPALGWPRDLARNYLLAHLRYSLTPPRRAGMERFFELAWADGLIEQVRPVTLHPGCLCG